jgi:hypothetical protein
MKYTPTFNTKDEYTNFGVAVDGKLTVKGSRTRPPRGQEPKPGRWFIERLLDDVKLSPGKHAVTLVFRNKDRVRTGMGERVASLWVANDAWFVPPGFILQVMFDKPTPWKRAE